MRSAIFGSTEPLTPHRWRLLPSTSREMLFGGLIGLSTPMEDSLGAAALGQGPYRGGRLRLGCLQG
ncbi:hypothetical protein B296_00058631 [Ensete ventricosum]|uniref:Uncharacterized protein n=1 Tax=Ensete ventricosum TaxID=4639 RepID=A0A426WVH4_ENSVE|nr:hypothetical protein B296_00058631 [Ensete ventricosum]